MNQSKNYVTNLYSDIFLGAPHISIAREVAKIRKQHLFVIFIKMLIAKTFFGIPIPDYALNGFESIPFKNWKSFIGKRKLTKIQNKLNPKSNRNLIDDKILFNIRCLRQSVPTPRILAITSNSKNNIELIPPDVRVISDMKSLLNFLHNKDIPNELIFKPSKGAYSQGFLSINFKPEGIFDAHGQLISNTDIFKHCFVKHKGVTIIVQQRLKPHLSLKPLMPGRALGCIRVVTYYDELQASVLFVFIKIPVGDNITDAFEHGYTGNLLGNVDLGTGKLGKAWGKRPAIDVYCLSDFTAHPTTGAILPGFQIPQWKSALKAAESCAKAFPELKLVGWDVALCEDGIYLLEGNNLWDPDGPQITLKRGIKKEMMALV